MRCHSCMHVHDLPTMQNCLNTSYFQNPHIILTERVWLSDMWTNKLFATDRKEQPSRSLVIFFSRDAGGVKAGSACLYAFRFLYRIYAIKSSPKSLPNNWPTFWGSKRGHDNADNVGLVLQLSFPCPPFIFPSASRSALLLNLHISDRRAFLTLLNSSGWWGANASLAEPLQSLKYSNKLYCKAKAIINSGVLMN